MLAPIDGLKNEAAAQFNAIASLHWNWGLKATIFIRGEIGVRIIVVGKRPTRLPTRGSLTLALEARNGKDGVVQSGPDSLMVRRSTTAAEISPPLV